MIRAAVVAALLAAVAVPGHAQRPEALWYMTPDETSVQSFLAHADQISIVAPQTFYMDSLGVISGDVDARVVTAAHTKHVKLVPLVMNPGFDQPSFHRVLVVPDARRRAVRALAALCRDQHFDGIQFDFENIALADRDTFTAFARESADSLHAAGCTLSAAVVPRASEFPGPTDYHRWMYENWRGAYDYKALADALDFLSFMTYAQHTGRTPPGPVAGYPWMEDALGYVLSLGVPPAKISLGLPSYSDWWHPAYDARTGAQIQGGDISYAVASGLLARHGVQPVWDDQQKVSYALWSNDGINEFLFLEDARAFMAKLPLVKRHGLRGYSVWVLGTEDPALWRALR